MSFTDQECFTSPGGSDVEIVVTDSSNVEPLSLAFPERKQAIDPTVAGLRRFIQEDFKLEQIWLRYCAATGIRRLGI